MVKKLWAKFFKYNLPAYLYICKKSGKCKYMYLRLSKIWAYKYKTAGSL